jgi:predicted hydrocarbon binding protein
MKAELEYDPKTGKMKAEGTESILVNRKMIADIQKEFEEIIGPASKRIIYTTAKNAVQQDIKECKKTAFLKLVGKKKRLEWMLNGAIKVGWGAMKLKEIDEKTSKVVIVVSNSFVGANYGKSNNPVCHIVAGTLSGFSSMALGKDMDCEEIECIAKRDKLCRFVAEPAKK